MNLQVTYFNLPVADLEAARTFYRDRLGLEETWREGNVVCAFALPGTSIQLMLTAQAPGESERAGIVFRVPSVDRFYQEQQSSITFSGEPFDVPGDGRWVSAVDAAGHGLYFVDIA